MAAPRSGPSRLIHCKEAKVHEAIASFDGYCTFKEVRKYLEKHYNWGLSPCTFSIVSYKLEAEGSVEKKGRGKYIYVRETSYELTEEPAPKIHKDYFKPKPKKPKIVRRQLPSGVIMVGVRYGMSDYPESRLPHPYEDLTKQDPVLLF